VAAIERLDQLRRRFRSRFDTNSDLTDYVGARDLQGLTPDPAWLEDHELPPEELLRERVDAWLAAQGESVDPRQLEPIDDVRSGNAAMLERDLPGAADVVFAWSTAQGTEPAESWSELSMVVTSVRVRIISTQRQLCLMTLCRIVDSISAMRRRFTLREFVDQLRVGWRMRWAVSALQGWGWGRAPGLGCAGLISDFPRLDVLRGGSGGNAWS